MFPQTLESWVILSVACLIGFVIGKWAKNKKNKANAGNAAITEMASTPPRKRVSKKERLKARRQSK